MRSTLILKALTGPQSGTVFTFDRHDMFVFGRSPDCQCAIPADLYISSRHFLLEVNPPDAELRDLGSKNGTYLNGSVLGGRLKGESPEGAAERSRKAAVKRGDRIKAGKTEFEVELRVTEDCSVCGAQVAVEEPHQEARGPFRCRACGRRAPGASPALPAVPRRVGGSGRFPGYSVDRELAVGGMGRVYLARAEGREGGSTGGLVAVKTINLRGPLASPRQADLFLREMRVNMGLEHPHIVKFIDDGRTSDGELFFVMEYCPSGTVADLIAKAGRINPREAGRLMIQALEGLACAHERGLVHRDLKPLNILLSGPGAAPTAKVADFGLAKYFIEAGLSGMTASGDYGGTLAFMPKEQLLDFRRAQPVSDVFAMGATLYAMVTGKSVYDSKAEPDPCAAILNDRLFPIRKRGVALPEALAAAVDRATEPDWRRRFPTARAFRESLAEALPP